MLKIAFRNIFRQRRRTILTVLMMFGGFTLASVSIAWSDGTYAHVINMFTSNQLGQIQVHYGNYLDRPTLYKTIDDYRQVGHTIGDVAAVVAWAPRLYAAGLGSVEDRSTAVRVVGIDPQLETEATRFERKIVCGKTLTAGSRGQAVLGKGLMTILEAELGDSVVIVSQAADGSIANDIYAITGVAESGDDLMDQRALYLHLNDAQELFVLPGRVHEIVVMVDDLDEVEETAAAIRTDLDNDSLNVATWREFAHNFYTAMKADQQGSWITLFVILLVVAVGVLNTVLMTVLERRREYGMLRAVGTAPGQLLRMVIAEIFFMAVISIVIGVGISYIINYIISIYGIPIPETFTYGGIEFSRLYSEINLRSYTIPGICVLATAFIVAVFPALRAAHIEPARAMRMH